MAFLSSNRVKELNETKSTGSSNGEIHPALASSFLHAPADSLEKGVAAFTPLSHASIP